MKEKNIEELNTMEAYMDEIEKSMKRLEKDDLLEGKVVSILDEEVIVNIGYVSDGIVRREEWMSGHTYEPEQEIAVLVINPHDQEGNVILSHKKAEILAGWEDLEDAYEEHDTVSVTIAEVVKGGVIGFYRGVRCFIPASLLSYQYVEALDQYLGHTLEAAVEDFDRDGKRVVLSRKAVELELRAKDKSVLMKELQTGEMRQGVVTKLMKFGAFVDLGGAEGLIHLNDLAWHRVNDPAEVVTVGDQVTVYVANIDQKTGRIGLVLKDVENDPWEGVAEYYQPGDYVQGKVVRLLNFGAFVEIEPGVEGVVFKSEITEDHIKNPADVLSIGDEVDAVIINVDEPNKKMSLSIKDAQGQGDSAYDLVQEDTGTTLGDLFGDKLKKLMDK